MTPPYSKGSDLFTLYAIVKHGEKCTNPNCDKYDPMCPTCKRRNCQYITEIKVMELK